MTELREFAQHSDDLDKLGVHLVLISVDNQQHTLEVSEKVAEKKFTILSDPGATVIKEYGFLHEGGGAARPYGYCAAGDDFGWARRVRAVAARQPVRTRHPEMGCDRCSH